jgi:nucleoredoxin
LVKFYNETSEKHPELEIIFVSSDRSAEAMAEYMAWGNMPFLAVNFDDRQMEALRKHAARGIPYLIVMDDQGNVVIEKPAGESWMYPGEALKQLKAKLGS